MLRIGNIQLENPLIMAPMAGITSSAFRQMMKKRGAAMVTTEMVSAAGLFRGNKKSLDYLKGDPTERPLAVQLFGSKVGDMVAAARIAVQQGADLVDINMGCPVQKVTRTGAGAALLKDLHKIARLISAVRISCNVPLTAKIRAGWSPGNFRVGEIVQVLEASGIDAITVHPRFASQGYSCPADWSLIREAKEQVNIPVIGNGDVFKPADAIRMRQATGCDGVMIGRGALGNPWIFAQILSLQRGKEPKQPSIEERRSHILGHFNLLAANMGERRAALCMRGLLKWYTKGLANSSLFRGRIAGIRDLSSLIRTMDLYFHSLEEKDL